MANDERVVPLVAADQSEIVSEFFITTCLKQPNAHDVIAAVLCGDLAALRDKTGGARIPLKTGSAAELCIKPILSCVGDLDVMFHHGTMLAVPVGYPPPTRLPVEFSSRVKVCEIIDSVFPGYVFLRLRYLLEIRSDDGTYSALQNDIPLFLSYNPSSKAEIHGPAETHQANGLIPSVDLVVSVRCLSWPPQAADWPTRHRNFSWPESATVDRIVGGGCDVVQVAHRLYRQQHGLPDKRQWRLSFSRAEVVLFNGCTPAQQIVYHMLRVFAKTERLGNITDNCGTRTLSSYHIKTLMLWACELQPRSLWSDNNLNVVGACAKLLRTLSAWLTNVQCPHYFVSKCNLIDVAFNYETITNRLTSITQSWLSTWFINNYIQKCSFNCPDSVSRLLDDVSTSAKLKNAVSAVIDSRLNTAQDNLQDVFSSTIWFVPGGLSRFKSSMTVRSCACLMKELTRIDSRLSVFFTAFTFLHISYKILIRGLNDELLDILATITGHFIGTRRYSNQRNMSSLCQAATFMKAVANNSARSTVQLIEIELSKAYLHKALTRKDSASDSVYCLANVYLAVLYYATGNYQKAADHCTLVTMLQDHKQCSSHTMQGELLPKVDDNIDNMLGLAALYQHLRTTVLDRQQRNVSVFTADMFARYLNICRLSVANRCHVTQMSSTAAVEQYMYIKYATDTEQPLLADLLLCKSVNVLHNRNFRHKRRTEQHRKPTTNTAELSTSELAELLQQSAVEYLTTFRQLAARLFESRTTIVTTDFKALYAYKHGDYQQCLQLCIQNLRALWNSAITVAFSVFPEFIQFLDDDFVSLTAVTYMTASRDFRTHLCCGSISQLTLSLYLMARCQLKLHHSVSQLARTLRHIEILQRKPALSEWMFDRLTLKLAERKIMNYLTTFLQYC